MKLSRRDRAACVLALECLRRRRDVFGVRLEGAERALALGGVFPRDIAGAAAEALTLMGSERWRLRGDWRGITPEDRRDVELRLALYLRALLRADAGDFGPRDSWFECPDHPAAQRPIAPRPRCCARPIRAWALHHPAPIRPLWESASKKGEKG